MSNSRALFVSFCLLTFLALFAGCPKDDEGAKNNAAAQQFWTAFESQGYAELPAVRAALGAELERMPGDAETTLLLAHANLWTLSEFGRTPPPVGNPSGLPARAIEAQQRFTEAKQLAPDDARIDGWLASMEIAMGNFTGNPEALAAGQARLASAVEAYPEFNGFVRGLIGGQMPTSDPQFDAGLEAMWLTLDRCAGTTVDRAHPDFAPYLSRKTATGVQRVCWNPTKAPHNFEGFFLYMGDLLVKAGELEQAAAIYGNAQLSDDYDAWPLKAELQARLTMMAERRALYDDADVMNDPLLAVQAPSSCAMCHAKQ